MRIVLLLLGLLILGSLAAGYYGSTKKPALHSYEQTLSDDRFAH
jgi:hypothetical protein